MAVLGLKNDNNAGKDEEVFHYPTSKNALIIFTRNPELGKCKTRLAATVGDDAALNIYKFLIKHTVAITTPLEADKFVYYSEKLHENDYWDTGVFRKKVQHGEGLGIRMQQAFTEVFNMGYSSAIIIGSDMFDMTTNDLKNAFLKLADNDAVIGPAEDGGYYLLGMKQIYTALFANKAWGTNSVLKSTLENLKFVKLSILDEKNDVDYYDDIKNESAFQKFFPEELKSK